MKMKDRSSQFKTTLGRIIPKETVKEILSIPEEDTTNLQGYEAYSLTDELKLISMLNTLKIEPQFYREENEIMIELRNLIEKIGFKDPYFVAQCIKYSRCMSNGLRDINTLAAALLAPFISGTNWGKRFYSLYNKKTKLGGCIYRVDDIDSILCVYKSLNKSKLSKAMKLGFKNVLESIDTYQLTKYSKTVIDIANLVHPNPNNSKALVTLEGKKAIKYCIHKKSDKGCSKMEVKTLDALMSGINISADTWEVANSEAGQEISKAIKEGKLTEEEAKAVLEQAKNQNFQDLLKEGKLGILAALRNIRQMLQTSDSVTINLLCNLISDGEKIRKGLIMPFQIDIAYEILNTEFQSYDKYSQVREALIKGYESSIPNLASILTGKTLVILDCSGSMQHKIYDLNSHRFSKSTCLDKAALIAATIVKATNADVIRFGRSAEYTSYNPNHTVFDIAHQLSSINLGATYLDKAWDLIRTENKAYDRIIILSDNECNSQQKTSESYKQYIHDVCSPYVYCCDMAAYGTTPLSGNKINYYCGYGYKLFDDIASNEFKPEMHIEEIKKVII